MASLTVQQLTGTAQPTLAAAAAGGDTTILDPAVRVKVNNGGGASITVTVTPVGPLIAGAAAKQFTVAAGGFEVRRVWDYPGHKGNPRLGRADITYSGVTTVTVGAFVPPAG